MPNMEPGLSPLEIEKELQKCVCKANEKKKDDKNCTRQSADEEQCGLCRYLGIIKHERANKCAKKIPRVEGEVGWADEMLGEPISPPAMVPLERGQMFRHGFKSFMGGIKWPDACRVEKIGDDILPSQFYDFKFKCPGATYDGLPPWGKAKKKGELGQFEKYSLILEKLRGKKYAEKNPPKKLDNTGCSNYEGKP